MTQVGPLLPMYVDSIQTVCLYVGSSVFVVLYNDHMLYDPGGASIAHVC